MLLTAQLFHFARARRGRVVAARWLLSLFMVFSFVSLATAAETHTHHPAQVVHDCMLCSAAADQLGDTPAPPALVLRSTATLSYAVRTEPVLPVLARATALLPPACGPPVFPA
ncbi:hypothetical protein [Massilia sp. TS11]|uniref:hypothetical protein n=1 Tax=Massilia sp. TS11 TaxID=2908003 RepID=UPI001EDC8678|nr:hypothetical protein [Massilia sp. TS11]MCG2585418.1 hypothetical protein [Massilia sp. TS11]